jgi:glycosyltransferase involved in cell wall biosynthesis
MMPKDPDISLFGRRIAIVLTTFDLGGAERQALHLASYLQDVRGAKVAVVGLFGGFVEQPVRKMCIERRLACVRVNMPEHKQGVPTFRSVRQFARDMAFLQPDILLPFMTLPNVLCGIVWQKVGASACIWNQRDEGRELAINRWHNLALTNVTHFISNSRDGVEYLAGQRGVPRQKINLIFNGVQLTAPQQPVAAVRHAIGASPSSFMAVMLANINQYKDHLTLIRAWKIVCDRRGDIDPILVLAGRKDYAEEIENLISELGLQRQIKMIGAVSDVSSLLHAADLAVFSTLKEGTPNGVLESMSAGLAVVATDIQGCRDALGPDYPALTPLKDANALAQHIIALAHDPARRAKLGAALSGRVSAEFSVTAMCEQTCGVIERALADGSARGFHHHKI